MQLGDPVKSRYIDKSTSKIDVWENGRPKIRLVDIFDAT